MCFSKKLIKLCIKNGVAIVSLPILVGILHAERFADRTTQGSLTSHVIKKKINNFPIPHIRREINKIICKKKTERNK